MIISTNHWQSKAENPNNKFIQRYTKLRKRSPFTVKISMTEVTSSRLQGGGYRSESSTAHSQATNQRRPSHMHSHIGKMYTRTIKKVSPRQIPIE